MRSEIINASRASLPAHVSSTLQERGFELDGLSYCKEGLTVSARGRWYVFCEEAKEPGNLRASPVGHSEPGFWKYVHDGALSQRLFEIPCWAVSVQPEVDRLDESGSVPFARLLAWALDTRCGRIPPDWRPPKGDLVRSWITPGGLTVQAKGYVRQTELALLPGRWALRTPVLASLADDLSAPRRLALMELVAEAQRRWAMVRLAVVGDSNDTALIAEVDFTGGPHSELLFSTGLDVLRHVVAWLVETAEVLADPNVAIVCLASGGDNSPILKGTNHEYR
jgi:hypothetical protein